MSYGPEDAESRQHDDRLFIDHINLIGDGPNADASAGGEDGGL